MLQGIYVSAWVRMGVGVDWEENGWMEGEYDGRVDGYLLGGAGLRYVLRINVLGSCTGSI